MDPMHAIGTINPTIMLSIVEVVVLGPKVKGCKVSKLKVMANV